MRISSFAKKAGAVTVAVAMLTSLASCDMIFGQKAVIEAAENFGDAVVSADAGKILKCSNEEDDSEVAEALELILDMDLRTDDFQEYADAMKDTMSYEVDNGSVKIDGKKATCDITFTIADYEDLDDGEYDDIDDLVDAIEDLDTKEYEFTVKFEKDGDDWVVTNLSSDDFGAIFEYLSYSLPVCNIAGDYVAVFDLTDTLESEFAEELGDSSYMTGTIEAVFMLTINEDGTFHFTLDSESLKNDLTSYISDNMDALFMSAFGATSVDELEEYAQLLGYDNYDALKADLSGQIEDSLADETIDTVDVTGTYTIEGNQITMSSDESGSVPTTMTIENGNIVADVDMSGSSMGLDSITLVFEPVSVG